MRSHTRGALVLLTMAIAFAGSAGALAQVQFVGVASGDASSTDAVVWTRAVDPAAPAATALTLKIAANDPTVTIGALTFFVTTEPAKDYTAKLLVGNLLPGTRYYYRFSAGAVSSNVGTFKTAPAATAPAAVRFGFSGDCDGLMRPYPLAAQVPAQNVDFFVFLGDTIYEAASSGSPAAALTGTLPAPSATGATQAQLFNDYSRKYREQFIAVNAGGQNCLQPFFAAQGNYTLLDNHELGNRQYINGGAPQGGPVGDMPTGAGVDARQSANDVNSTGAFMNKTAGYGILQQVYRSYEPVKDRGTISAATDPRTDGTQLMYFAQKWGSKVVFVNVDDRSYRDIRMKTAANADDTTAPRANNSSRTMLGVTQLAWLKQTLLDAQTSGVVWKFVAVSSPIDQLGPIGGSLGAVGNGVSSDGGKSWMGQYRAERNDLLKFIADNHIYNVVFLSTDDHQNRVNEVLYSPTGQTEVQTTYVPVPHCFIVVDGPLGATGPDTITNHTFANLQSIATGLVNAQVAAGLDPIGLAPGYPGLHDVVRESDPTADANRSAIDFYSPDTFNFATLDVSADGLTLSVSVTGINSTPTNSFLEYDPVGNPARQILSFKVDGFVPCAAPPCGQLNTSCASLLVNGTGSHVQGPIDVSVPAGTTLSLSWAGPAGQPVVLAGSPAFVVGQNLGGLLVDLDLPGVSILLDGTDPFWGFLFTTNGSGSASQSFSVPSTIGGSILRVQGAIYDTANTCSWGLGIMTTASFAIHF